MKNARHLFMSLAILLTSVISSSASAQQPSNQSQWNASAARPLKVGIVNTKRCLDESKLGKQEQANFERMKSQMESVLQEKEKSLEEIESKLNDEDYMDSVSAEVESELKRKKRSIRQEGVQLQNQYMHTLQQANVKIVQKITETITKASSQIAQDLSTNGEPSFDVILTDEACTYFAKPLDVTDKIIAKMDQLFETERQDNQNSTRNDNQNSNRNK